MDLGSLFSGLTTQSDPSSYRIEGVNPSINYNMSGSPAKPGFDWGAFGAASGDFLGGVSNVIRAIRGEPVYAQPMAGSRLQNYLNNKEANGDSSLSDLLKEILSKYKSDKSKSDPDNPELYNPDSGRIDDTWYPSSGKISETYNPDSGKLNLLGDLRYF